ncbi:hypothetical protein ATY75_31925 [Rhizobium sp. N122]|nr:hypothetical protein ATY75_31925 [Rhizobium sp. N122]
MSTRQRPAPISALQGGNQSETDLIQIVALYRTPLLPNIRGQRFYQGEMVKFAILRCEELQIRQGTAIALSLAGKNRELQVFMRTGRLAVSKVQGPAAYDVPVGVRPAEMSEQLIRGPGFPSVIWRWLH